MLVVNRSTSVVNFFVGMPRHFQVVVRCDCSGPFLLFRSLLIVRFFCWGPLRLSEYRGTRTFDFFFGVIATWRFRHLQASVRSW
jgi:hypothetical protein